MSEQYFPSSEIILPPDAGYPGFTLDGGNGLYLPNEEPPLLKATFDAGDYYYNHETQDNDLRALRTPRMDAFFDYILASSEEIEKEIYGRTLDRLNNGTWERLDDDVYDPAYKLLYKLQIEEDRLLLQEFPEEWEKAEQYLGPTKKRWEVAMEFRVDLLRIIHELDMRLVGLAGIKTNARALEKASRCGLPLSQLTDIVRMRLVTSNHSGEHKPVERQFGHADDLYTAVRHSEKFGKSIPHIRFSRVNPRVEGKYTDVHDSSRSTLYTYSYNNYHRVRHNPIYNGYLAEIQIVPYSEFTKLNEEHRIRHNGKQPQIRRR